MIGLCSFCVPIACIMVGQDGEENDSSEVLVPSLSVLFLVLLLTIVLFLLSLVLVLLSLLLLLLMLTPVPDEFDADVASPSADLAVEVNVGSKFHRQSMLSLKNQV
jgi:hypothetical protein